MSTPKAIALMSGGLDSTLAAKIIKDHGVEVIGLHLLSPFGCKTDVEKSANAVGIPLRVKEKGEAYLDLVNHPRFGYGKNMNPCIDCRIFMFQLAEVVMEEEHADFVVTGEVMGQRPMSQQRHSMELIDKNSPLHGRLVRPLSAHHFEPSIPEQKGWVDREKLFDISGRSRKEQLSLAQSFGITDFEAPGGGCLLTEQAFSNKLRDWIKNPTYENSEQRIAQSALVRLGRHFRVSEKLKIIVGRDESENAELEKLWAQAGATHFYPENFQGPSAVTLGTLETKDRDTVSRLISRYSRLGSIADKEITFESPQGLSGKLPVLEPISEETLSTWRL